LARPPNSKMMKIQKERPPQKQATRGVVLNAERARKGSAAWIHKGKPRKLHRRETGARTVEGGRCVEHEEKGGKDGRKQGKVPNRRP